MGDLEQKLEMDSKFVMSGICNSAGFCFKIPCYSGVTLVEGDSGSGKTYFLKRLKFVLEDGAKSKNKIQLSNNYEPHKLHALLHPMELDGIEDNLRANFFIIDRFNLATERQIAKAQRLLDNNCIFVLFNRYYNVLYDGGPVTEFKLTVEQIDKYMKYFKFSRYVVGM